MSETKKITIEFNKNGEGTLRCSLGSFKCLGCPGTKYPKDMTVTTRDKYRVWYSREYGVNMYYSILIWGQKGIFIHEGAASLASNGGTSAGCIHVDAPYAKKLFDWLDTRARVVINYQW